MDLRKYNLAEQADKGSPMPLVDPVTGEKLLQNDGSPVSIHVTGIDSAAYRNKQREIGARRMARIARGKKPDYIASDDDACELLAACTVGWSGIVLSGETMTFSQQAARDLYQEFSWIREQVDQFIGDRANFFTMS